MRLKCNTCKKITEFKPMPMHEAYKSNKFTLVGNAYKCNECGEVQIMVKRVKTL